MELKSDELRRREARQRRESPWWGVGSFVFHVLLFVAIVWLTPAKKLFQPEKKQSDAAKDLSAERIEQISDNLSQIRVNELLKELEELQAVLHNMDLLKEQLQKDYDSFAAAQQQGPTLEETKKHLAEVIDEVETNQSVAITGHDAVRAVVTNLVQLEALDLKDKNTGKALSSAVGGMESVADVMSTAQGNAQNGLDRIQSAAEFAGLGKTAAAAEKLRDAQIEVARMQNSAQGESEGIAWKLSSYANNIGWYNGEKRSLENARRNASVQEAALKNAKLALEDAQDRFAEDQAAYDKAQADVAALDAESKRIEAELAAERQALDAARKEQR